MKLPKSWESLGYEMHKPVLLNEVIKFLDPRPHEFFIDGTLNGGGHAASILEKMMPEGKFLAIDWDSNILKKTKEIIEAKFQIPNPKFQIFWVNDNYKNMKSILEKEKLGKADGLLLDLGFSSEQIENSGRGFSFQKDEPLLMTYSEKSKPVFKWLENLKESELAKIIKYFGEEKFASRIAKAIKKNLPIERTGKLVQTIKESVPRSYERERLNPATRTFQALRIFANQELENLKLILADLPQILNKGGRAVVISFHSLEDRIVKRSFRSYEIEGQLEILTKKPIVSTEEEVRENPRARSAKLRAAKIL